MLQEFKEVLSDVAGNCTADLHSIKMGDNQAIRSVAAWKDQLHRCQLFKNPIKDTNHTHQKTDHTHQNWPHPHVMATPTLTIKERTSISHISVVFPLMSGYITSSTKI